MTLHDNLDPATLNAVKTVVAEFPYHTMFAVVSGSHSYGFPSYNSDVDVRVVYTLPLEQVIGLRVGREEIHRTETVTIGSQAVVIDLVAMELGKYCRLLANGDGNSNEWLHSPLVIEGYGAMRDLVSCMVNSANLSTLRHYVGFAQSQSARFYFGKPEGEGLGYAKSFLYCARLLLTGLLYLHSGGEDVVLDPQLALLLLKDSPYAPAIDDIGKDEFSLGVGEALQKATADKRQSEKAMVSFPVENGVTTLRLLAEVFINVVSKADFPNKPSEEVVQRLDTYLRNIRLPAKSSHTIQMDTLRAW